MLVCDVIFAYLFTFPHSILMLLASENSRGQIASFLSCLETAPDGRLDAGASEGLVEHISAAKPDYIRTGDGWPVSRPSSDVNISSILCSRRRTPTNRGTNQGQQPAQIWTSHRDISYN